jgi:hypothetical protein
VLPFCCCSQSRLNADARWVSQAMDDEATAFFALVQNRPKHSSLRCFVLVNLSVSGVRFRPAEAECSCQDPSSRRDVLVRPPCALIACSAARNLAMGLFMNRQSLTHGSIGNPTDKQTTRQARIPKQKLRTQSREKQALRQQKHQKREDKQIHRHSMATTQRQVVCSSRIRIRIRSFAAG